MKAVGVMLFICSCIKLTLGVLQCTGKRQNDGQILYEMLHDKGFSDCEIQLIVNSTVVGLVAEGKPRFTLPITNMTASTATLQACPKNLKCHLSCPTGEINEIQQCSCDIVVTTSLPKVVFSDRSFDVWIGVSAVILLVFAIIAFVLYKRKPRPNNDLVPTEETEELGKAP
ncbi:hypothetical protein QQF64_019923 [Cirrhinus molitorella]|uniref:Uncharacterized protein n=1 Tax=Cirrhinus molitorella TaxID=172907 RepID=A0ABR3LGU6_9TELE